MKAYYNENDSFAAAWLRELIKGGHIAPGVVDERSIEEVQPNDLAGYNQVHLFAGIGGWSYALRLAGWPDDRSVWTGSCPCQPFSLCGDGRAESDSRHLWPVFARLVRECRPSTVIGEQVASPLGRKWLLGVFNDLENMGYAGAGADLCAPGVGAAHQRQRLYWVAHPNGTREQPRIDSVPCPTLPHEQTGGDVSSRGSSGFGVWDPYDVRIGRDGRRYRVAVGSGPCPLANGVPARVGRLHGYGNAIVPQVAAAFVRAYRETLA